MSRNPTKHAWLSLIDVSGPFLAPPVLDEVFPDGMDPVKAETRKRVRQTYEEWLEAVDAVDPLLHKLHQAWVSEILGNALELDVDGKGDVLKRSDWCVQHLANSLEEHGVTLAPDMAVVDDQAGNAPLMLIQVYDPDVDLEQALSKQGWVATPADRMVALCRAAECRLGMITNGERWMFIDAPVGATTSYASWYSRIWVQEPETLQAFINLFDLRRFYTAKESRLPALLDRSVEFQDEVTDSLGEQVRRAVEVLIQALDKADQDRNRELLRGISEPELYESALTLMMRLVFLLSAEERGLLLMGNERYEAHYALSTLRMQLRAESDEILERRWDAWSRLLALFRVVYGGSEHPDMRLPALGGSLFDPDRFAFLEGRAKGSKWKTDPASPLPIDNRTVLLLLESIQLHEGRTLSYRALDVEQIGYVYEGLLERTVRRAEEVTLRLKGTQNAKNPWVTLPELESARLDGNEKLAELLKERTASTASRIRNALARPVDDELSQKLLTSCQGNLELRDRIKPYCNLIDTDWNKEPLVYLKGSFMVRMGSDRRETGTHYTPKSLTEAIVTETLTPIVYVGPAEGEPKVNWRLKAPHELLDLKICDPAMGSGAFLVQACRWLAERLVESWEKEESLGKRVSADGVVLAEGTEQVLLPRNTEERANIARRLIAERCLYGVDLNPLAVELAKLSIWLITMARGLPFGFLDHNLRHGDSLLGIHRLDQLTQLSMTPGEAGQQQRLFGQSIEKAVEEAIALRRRLRETPIRDIRDVEAMERLNDDARRTLMVPEQIADAFVGVVFAPPSDGNTASTMAMLSATAEEAVGGNAQAIESLKSRARTCLAKDLPESRTQRYPLHWPLEFPEVFEASRGGFDGIVGNPPFMGGRLIQNQYGKSYFDWLRYIRNNVTGSPDLVVFFLLRAASLMRKKGTLGIISTSSIRDTGNRVVGIDQLLTNGFTIYSANPRMPWPGTAKVEISTLSVYFGNWNNLCKLGHTSVDQISSSLTAEKTFIPLPLISNKTMRSDGFTLMGEGFILTRKERDELAARDSGVEDYIFPFFSGEDLADLPRLQDHQRFAIDFNDRELDAISSFSHTMARIEETVKPFRDKQTGQIHQTSYWKYWDMRPKLREYQSKDLEYLICPSTAKYVFFRRYSGRAIFRHKVKILFLDGFDHFAILQSAIHDIWVRATSGTRVASSIEYNSSRSFGTFPFCSLPNKVLSGIGQEYYNLRDAILETNGFGPTSLYNIINRPDNNDSQIQRLREITIKMDSAVCCAYGWPDIELLHDFYEVEGLANGDRIRFTVCGKARSEILNRLILLNRKQHHLEAADVAESNNSTRFSKASLTNRNQENSNTSKGSANINQRNLFYDK